MSDDKIPPYFKEAIDAWVATARSPGHALRAILENDLRVALIRADDNVGPAMRHIVKYLYNECPAECWGSMKNVDEWRGRQ